MPAWQRLLILVDPDCNQLSAPAITASQKIGVFTEACTIAVPGASPTAWAAMTAEVGGQGRAPSDAVVPGNAAALGDISAPGNMAAPDEVAAPGDPRPGEAAAGDTKAGRVFRTLFARLERRGLTPNPSPNPNPNSQPSPTPTPTPNPNSQPQPRP